MFTTEEIYNLNKIAYLIMNDIPVRLVKKQNLVYAIVHTTQRYRDVVEKYNELQTIYKNLKKF